MIGQKLGSFTIESELGSGAMGIVYRGVQDGKNRTAAIKVISAEQIGKGKSFERFIREAQILEQFRHPNIVRYLARGKSGGTYYYAMEFVPGPTLEKILGEHDTLPWREVVAIGVQLCDALQYAHERGIVHRDLKPSNLMLSENGQLKLTDFGIAKDLDGTALTATGRTLGTAAYMAPEQIRGTPEVSHKTDLYALGSVLYQMLTGSPPFSGSSPVVLMHAHINQPAPRPSAKVEEIPRALDDLVFTLMAKAPADRPWDAVAVAEVLRALLEKDARKEKIEMVWPEAGSAGAMPTRAEFGVGGDGTSAGRGSGGKKRRGKKGHRLRERLTTLGLVAALAGLGGLVAYLVWPAGPETLYRKAEPLMASSDPFDWIRARDEYLDPLDARFPQHAHRDQTEAWRDRIDLRDAERRAEVLEKANLAAFSKPKTEAEALYQHTFEEAEAARKIHHDADAQALWAAMGKQLARDTRQDRGWVLLADRKAAEVAQVLKVRRDTVAGLMARAALPEALKGSEAAVKYSRETLRDVVDRFGKYPDVADLVGVARASLDASGPSKAAPPEG